ncbi:MAG TPA: quinolinate synthase NadA [Phycisphaerae bacterium]|jgi:quinolinate synthase|nr:quinolinate synthase NadA [Phycisphaerae bacterium]HOB73850.1 quinolinate synthase NadA [Phycisphaerae bacterium]HOJ53935.1 quinolinate synthase NadA [Phycisphaerae bacterium]HOL27473.1 quinolinate synthase NadA [Phycisphaerae bacterium]HPP21669.1 quinolinate synthase NadA [Phycisphaerae bacterium]
MMLFQPPLPPHYAELSDEEMADRVRAHKQAFGDRLIILGHHYQQDDVIQFADHAGDSLKLSQLAAKARNARYVVFCGVHFMAESADILTEDEVTVILPDLSAGCSMADMAAIDQVEEAWEQFQSATDARIIPITYVNSTADIKAFVGRHDGACCTSSNARRVVEWALGRGEKILFLPDQHLGRNTAYALGYPLDSMVVYDPNAVDGGLTSEQIRNAKFLLWKGHCSVHGLFTAKHCDLIREADPACKIIVHPECRWEVVQKADVAGSTEYIVKALEEAPDATSWAVGTEIHLVNRLANKYAGRKLIRSLAGVQCLCTTMYRIDLRHLLWSLDELAAGRIVNQIKVDPDTRHWARVSLQRMLDNVPPQPMAAK